MKIMFSIFYFMFWVMGFLLHLKIMFSILFYVLGFGFSFKSENCVFKFYFMLGFELSFKDFLNLCAYI